MSRLLGAVVVTALAFCGCGTVSSNFSISSIVDDSPKTGEKLEEYKYIVNDTEEKTGNRRVLTLELGNGVELEVVRIKAGKFTMGSPVHEKSREDDEVQHEVTLTTDFYLGKYEVTQEQYEAVMGKNPSRFKGKRLPVESVNPDEAAAFCDALGKKLGRQVKLPSEAQWEYACRAGTTTPYHFGSKLNGSMENTDKSQAVVVGGYRPNGFGLHDMHGNVKEYCRDYYGPYDKIASNKDPVQLTKPTQDWRVARGGSFYRNGRECRSADRVPCEYSTNFRAYDLGFRICVQID
jgi:eukaryotic-like serine/threonine-protein kinase